MEYKDLPDANEIKTGDVAHKEIEQLVDLEKVPSFTVKYDPIETFSKLQTVLSGTDEEEIVRALITFKVSLIQNQNSIPEDLLTTNVSEVLVSLTPPHYSQMILDESILTSCAWTGVQNEDLGPYVDDDYFKVLYNYAIENSATEEELPKCSAALCLIKNITFESCEKTQQLVSMNGLESFSLLFNEVKSVDMQKMIVKIVKNALKLDDIPLEFGHFAIDMYMPTLRSSLESLTPLDIELIHLFCLTGIDYVRYFMDNIGPQKFFNVYETATLDVRIAILKMWNEMCNCPDKDVAYSSMFVPWDTFVRALEIDESNKELQCICDLLIRAFSFKGDVENKIIESLILYKLLSIVERGKLKMRKTAIETLTILVEDDTKIITDYIITNKHLHIAIEILELDDPMSVEFALRLLLKIVTSHFDPPTTISIVQQLTDSQFDEIENELFDNDELDAGAMYEVFIEQAKDLIDNCPDEPVDEDESNKPDADEHDEEEDEEPEKVMSEDLLKFLKWKKEQEMAEARAFEAEAEPVHVKEEEEHPEDEDDGFEDV